MVPDEIERDTVIDAPVERVWDADHRARARRPLVRRRRRRDRPSPRRRDGDPLGRSRHHPRPRRRGRAAHAASPTAGRRSRSPAATSRSRATRRWSSSPSSPRATARGCVWSRAASPRSPPRAPADQEPRGQHRGLGVRARRAAPVRGGGSPSDERAGGEACSPRWRTRPAGACSACSPSAARPPRRRWPASCRSAAWRWSSTWRSSIAPGSSRAGAKAARSATRVRTEPLGADRPLDDRHRRRSGTPAWRRSSASPRTTRDVVAIPPTVAAVARAAALHRPAPPRLVVRVRTFATARNLQST